MTRLIGCLVLVVFMPLVVVVGLYAGAFHLLAAFSGSSVSIIAGHPDRPMATTRRVLNFPTAERWFSPLAAMEAAVFARTLADDRPERTAINAAVLATNRAGDQIAVESISIAELDKLPTVIPPRPKPVWCTVTKRGESWRVHCFHPDSGWTEWKTDLTSIERR